MTPDRVHVLDDADFHTRYEGYFGDDGQEHVTNAYVDRSDANNPQIIVHSDRANGGTVQHELTHMASNPEFRGQLGRNLNEATTEYFTLPHTNAQGIDRSTVEYNADGRVRVIEDMARIAGRDRVEQAYFGEGGAGIDDLRAQVDASQGAGTFDQVVARANRGDYAGARALLAPPAGP